MRYRVIPIVLTVLGGSAGAAEPTKTTLHVENDAFTGSDQYYTNGLRLSHGWSSQASFPTALDGAFGTLSGYGLGVAFGQNMFTPTNIRTPTPDPKDRPYGGWTYLSGLASLEWRNQKQRLTRGTAQVSLGVMGPWSQAGTVQARWHALLRGVNGTDSPPHPEGWDNQIPNQPALQLGLRVDHELFPASTAAPYRDLYVTGRLELGNVFSFVAGGATLRIGRFRRSLSVTNPIESVRFALLKPAEDDENKVELQGVAQERDTCPWEAYLYVRAEGRAVAHNAFLDGPPFAESRRVQKMPWVADGEVGLAGRLGPALLEISGVLRTQELAHPPPTATNAHAFVRIQLSVLRE